MIYLTIINKNQTVFDGQVEKVELINEIIGSIEFQENCENCVLEIISVTYYIDSTTPARNEKFSKGIAHFNENHLSIIIEES